MNKAILVGIIVVLIVAVLGVGVFALRERHEKEDLGMRLALSKSTVTTPALNRPRPMLFLKGSNFTDNPLSSKAYLIAPVTGTLSADAQKAMTGWTMSSTPNNDGTTTVTLTPKEAEDVQQVFTLKSGDKLYFLEMTLTDDATGVDENRGDDMGILVNSDGVVQ